MSQQKVDKYKQEKYARKHQQKKTNVKKIISYVIATVIAVAFVIYIGYSVAIATGLYKPETTTVKTTMTADEIESLRNTLIQNGDTNVKEDTTAADENATDAAETTVADDAKDTTAAETTTAEE